MHHMFGKCTKVLKTRDNLKDDKLTQNMSQPHFEGSVRSLFTLPKMGLGSPLGLPKIHNSIARAKTPRIEVFFIPLERS
jgi:hypothetical protein